MLQPAREPTVCLKTNAVPQDVAALASVISELVSIFYKKTSKEQH